MSNFQEAASDEHQRLVGALIDQFIADGLKIVKAAYDGFEEAYERSKVSMAEGMLTWFDG